ncbi:unnamed protein product [Adineta steineri]|uniref:Uncharacterized protein n=1 Tax=Adineta steineri TaxID=433720 RepID=A0A815I114_9BILA|nr:unnamed protein product [Adineta steineri]CAF1410693.1 unnamed protein product [Adineta steineri]CAF3579735.1 unnamed protein product [Adineta steineri]CAF3842273.1 unnamed protein product [Adineta steineri]
MFAYIKLLILLILLNIAGGTSKSRSHRTKISRVSKSCAPDCDNRYVWFTRSIHDEVPNTDKYQPLYRTNNLRKLLFRKELNMAMDQLLTT